MRGIYNKVQWILLKIIKKSKFNQILLVLCKLNKQNTCKNTNVPVDYACKNAIEVIDNYSKNPNTSAMCARVDKWNETPLYDLAIIVPIYNVEKYVRKCIESLLNQKTQYRYQMILINDGTRDNSIAAIRDFIYDDKIIYIQQENKGFSGARNTGLSRVNAKYITFVDSDDYVQQNMIERLLSWAYKMDADIVQGSYITVDESGNQKSKKQFDNTICKNYYALPGYPWGKVFRSSLFSKLQFPEGYWFEDSIMGHLIYPLTRKIVTISDSVYCYRDNTKGISRNILNQRKALDSTWITVQMLKDRKKLGLENDQEYLTYFLNQIIMNFQRTLGIGREIKFAVFVWMRILIAEEFSVNITKDRLSSWNYLLYQALNDGDFRTYHKICKYSDI